MVKSHLKSYNSFWALIIFALFVGFIIGYVIGGPINLGSGATGSAKKVLAENSGIVSKTQIKKEQTVLNDEKTELNKDTFLVSPKDGEMIFPSVKKTYNELAQESGGSKDPQKTVTITYHFIDEPEAWRQGYFTAIGKTNSEERFVELDHQSFEYTFEHTETYEINESVFDLFILLFQYPRPDAQEKNVYVTFYTQSFDLSEEDSLELDVFLSEGVPVQTNVKELAEERISVNYIHLLFELMLEDCDGELPYGCGIGFNLHTGSNSLDELNLKINFNSIHEDYISVLRYNLFEDVFEDRFLLPIIFSYPFTNLTAFFPDESIKSIDINIFDNVKEPDDLLNMKWLEIWVNPLGRDMSYSFGTNAENILPASLTAFVLEGYSYIISSEISDLEGQQVPVLNRFLKRNKGVNVDPTSPVAPTMNFFEKPFTLVLGDCNEFSEIYEDYTFEKCLEPSIVGVVFDPEDEPNYFVASSNPLSSGGHVILELPDGTGVKSDKKGSSFSLGCNLEYATINLEDCPEGLYKLDWVVEDVFKGSTPHTTAQLFYDGNRFSILSQSHDDLFVMKHLPFEVFPHPKQQ